MIDFHLKTCVNELPMMFVNNLYEYINFSDTFIIIWLRVYARDMLKTVNKKKCRKMSSEFIRRQASGQWKLKSTKMYESERNKEATKNLEYY